MLDLVRTVRNQVRATGFGAVGLDFPAVLNFAEATGAPLRWLPDILPDVERALLIFHNTPEETS